MEHDHEQLCVFIVMSYAAGYDGTNFIGLDLTLEGAQKLAETIKPNSDVRLGIYRCLLGQVSVGKQLCLRGQTPERTWLETLTFQQPTRWVWSVPDLPKKNE